MKLEDLIDRHTGEITRTPACFVTQALSTPLGAQCTVFRMDQAQRPILRAALLGGVAASLLAGVLAGCGGSSKSNANNSPAPSTPVHQVSARLDDFKVSVTPKVATSGRVTFNVANDGGVAHEFVVIKTPKRASALGQGGRADETGRVGEIDDLQPGQQKTISLQLPTGHYALICNIANHFQQGMHTDFSVR